jgi:hypothetical protein
MIHDEHIANEHQLANYIKHSTYQAQSIFNFCQHNLFLSADFYSQQRFCQMFVSCSNGRHITTSQLLDGAVFV